MILIRKAQENDILCIVDFQQRLASETEDVILNADTVSSGLKNLFADASKGQYYVAEYNKEIVGCFFITYEWSEWRNGNVWWLQSVYVKKDHRNLGVFKKMYAFIQQSIKDDPNILGLRLYADKRNDRAQNVYRNLGMNGDHYTVFEWMK